MESPRIDRLYAFGDREFRDPGSRRYDQKYGHVLVVEHTVNRREVFARRIHIYLRKRSAAVERTVGDGFDRDRDTEGFQGRAAAELQFLDLGDGGRNGYGRERRTALEHLDLDRIYGSQYRYLSEGLAVQEDRVAHIGHPDRYGHLGQVSAALEGRALDGGHRLGERIGCVRPAGGILDKSGHILAVEDTVYRTVIGVGIRHRDLGQGSASFERLVCDVLDASRE